MFIKEIERRPERQGDTGREVEVRNITYKLITYNLT